jgi:hypothetical protein
MNRTAASFALATLSLLASYAIVTIWPDRMVSTQTAIAAVGPVTGVPVAAQAEPTMVGLAD